MVKKNNKSKEWKRGYNWANKNFSKFRSFKRRSDGSYIGYKKSGGTEVIGRLQDYKGRDPFYSGSYTAIKEHIKARPVKKRKKSSSYSFDIWNPF